AGEAGLAADDALDPPLGLGEHVAEPALALDADDLGGREHGAAAERVEEALALAAVAHGAQVVAVDEEAEHVEVGELEGRDVGEADREGELVAERGVPVEGAGDVLSRA